MWQRLEPLEAGPLAKQLTQWPSGWGLGTRRWGTPVLLITPPPPMAVGDPGAAHHPHPPSPRDTAVGDPNTARPLPRARFAACDIVGRDSNAVL